MTHGDLRVDGARPQVRMGWGQVFERMLVDGADVKVVNLAQSGRSARSFTPAEYISFPTSGFGAELLPPTHLPMELIEVLELRRPYLRWSVRWIWQQRSLKWIP